MKINGMRHVQGERVARGDSGSVPAAAAAGPLQGGGGGAGPSTGIPLPEPDAVEEDNSSTYQSAEMGGDASGDDEQPDDWKTKFQNFKEKYLT